MNVRFSVAVIAAWERGRKMRILVAYASRHGATRGIAERVAHTLERNGLEVTLAPVDLVGDVAAYDAFVIGSAAYVSHWLKEATSFVREHRTLLASRPVWLFSSGPIGTEAVDAKGQDVVEASIPTEFAEFAEALRPRDRRIFFGAFDPDAKPIGIMERLGAPFLHMASVKEALPAGDFRDWPAIESWADDIARELQRAPAVTAVPA
jgi:menaquinone-dependent protoporphyrinogen oxidase